MTYELDLFGAIVPSLLLWAVVAFALARAISRFTARAGLQRHIWHPALFDFSLFVCLLAALVFFSRELVS